MILTLSQFFVLMDTRPGAAKTLGRLLDDYYSIRPFGGMVVPWVPFGSSGHVTRPKVRRRPHRHARLRDVLRCRSEDATLGAAFREQCRTKCKGQSADAQL